MIIDCFELRLRKLNLKDIELVREMRNSNEISQFMDFREHITRDMQKEWYNSLDKTSDFYFIIEYKDDKIGLINTSQIDWSLGTANTGLFIWNNEYIGTHIPVLASLAMLEVFFSKLHLVKVYAKVLNSNSGAIEYNKGLGFVKTKTSEGFGYYSLSRSRYNDTRKVLMRLAKRFGDYVPKLKVEKDLHAFFKSRGVNFLES